MDRLRLIESTPGVRGGKPRFVGTRITVYDVLEYLAAGMTTDEIVADFPELSVDHVRRRSSSLPSGSVGSAPPREAAPRPEPVASPVEMLADEYPGSRHVVEVGLDVATDQDLWEYARRHGLAITSKDADFRQLASSMDRRRR